MHWLLSHRSVPHGPWAMKEQLVLSSTCRVLIYRVQSARARDLPTSGVLYTLCPGISARSSWFCLCDRFDGGGCSHWTKGCKNNTLLSKFLVVSRARLRKSGTGRCRFFFLRNRTPLLICLRVFFRLYLAYNLESIEVPGMVSFCRRGAE